MKIFFVALFNLAFLLSSIELAAYDPCCEDNCWGSTDWACWIGGALLGAAAGAGTGYAAGHCHGKKGKKGPTGPTGPTGPAGGFALNTTNSLLVTLDRSGILNEMLEFEFQVVNPIGEILFTQIFTGSSVVPDIAVDIAAMDPKVEGDYLIRWTILTAGGGAATPTSTLGVATVTIDGNPSSIIQTPETLWIVNQFEVNYFTFP